MRQHPSAKAATKYAAAFAISFLQVTNLDEPVSGSRSVQWAMRITPLPRLTADEVTNGDVVDLHRLLKQPVEDQAAVAGAAAVDLPAAEGRQVHSPLGGIRDLEPLTTVPGLRALWLYQVRELDTADLDALGNCKSLMAVSLGALRNVTRLTALTRGPRETMRYLILERMLGLETLADLAACEALEQLFITEAKPKDGRLDVIAQATALRHLVVGDHYSKKQLAATETAFRGETLWVRGVSLRGDTERGDVDVRWRRPVEQYLSLPASTSPD